MRPVTFSGLLLSRRSVVPRATPVRAGRLVVLACAALALGGCTTVIVEPQALGGSKSDGIVEVGYGSGGFQLQEGDWEAGARNAEKSCQGWGYSAARRFGEPAYECTRESDGYTDKKGNFHPGSCIDSRIVAKYQCVD